MSRYRPQRTESLQEFVGRLPGKRPVTPDNRIYRPYQSRTKPVGPGRWRGDGHDHERIRKAALRREAREERRRVP